MRERGGGGDEDGANAPISLEERGDESYLFSGVRCFPAKSTFTSLGFGEKKTLKITIERKRKSIQKKGLTRREKPTSWGAVSSTTEKTIP